MTISIIDVKTRVESENDAYADRVRAYTKNHHTYVINIMSSPGSGKTTTLISIINRLKKKYRIGVMEADVDSVVDAKTIEEKTGCKAIQLHTGGACHMDAGMTFDGLQEIGLEDLDIVFLENVGNLVCPAELDTGSDLNIEILSIPEGDDKPLKYPLMFKRADVVLFNKIDALEVFDFDIVKAKERILKLNPNMEFFQISALKDEGIEEVSKYIESRIDHANH